MEIPQKSGDKAAEQLMTVYTKFGYAFVDYNKFKEQLDKNKKKEVPAKGKVNF